MPGSLVTTCLEILVKVSIQAAALAALVWLVTRMARKAPAAWRNALWLVVLVKFLVPPFAHYPSGLAFWQTHGSQTATVDARSAMPAAYGGVAPPVRTSAQPEFREGAPAPAASRRLTDRGRELAGTWQRLTAASALVPTWLAGVVLMLALLAIRFARQVRLVHEASAAPTELVDLLRESAACFGMTRPPDLRLSRDARTPMLVGCLRPVILLPQGIADRCRAGDLRAMLLHELAHVKRRDMAVVWLQQLTQALFYFHPAVWLAGREIRRERELACDELVLSKSAIPAKDYAAGYVSALRLANGVPSCSASLAMAEPFDIERRRLDTILKSAVRKPSARWIVAGALIAVVGLPTYVGLASRRAEDARDLLAHVREAREKALADVKSGKGSLVYTERDSHQPDYKAREQTIFASVSFSGEKFAILLVQPPLPDSQIVSDGHTVWLTAGSPDHIVNFPLRSQEGRLTLSSYRQLFDVVDRTYPDLEKVLLYHKGAPRVVGHETIDGSECVVVESVHVFPQKDGKKHVDTRRLWIDPAKGYAVPKLQVFSEGREFEQKAILSQTNVRLSQYDGIWGPARYVHEEYRADPRTGVRYLSARTVVTYGRDFALNVPVSDPDLNLPLPAAERAPADSSQAKELQDARVLAGLTAVEGPGVIVTLRDCQKLNPKEKRPEVRENYVVHDTDVRNIVNELFAAGAEAVSVNGQRIVATSSIRCVGPLIMVNSVQVQEPYVINAIGQPETLQKALELPGGPADGLFLLDMIEVRKQASITVPAYKGNARFELARPAA